MSMSVEQRRTEILDRQDFPCGSIRWTKACNRYDRRYRHYAIEFLPTAWRGGHLEDYGWRVCRDWPVSDYGSRDESYAAYQGALLVLRELRAEGE